jgi:hypothetical protein
MKIDKSTIISLLSLLLLVGCNKKEYCDFSTYDVSTVLHYDWAGVTEKVPASLNNIMTSSAASTSFVSASDWYQLKQEDGNYNVFAWNDAENVTVSNKIITVAKNDDGSLKSVGELFTGERDFNIKNATAEDNEAGNHHHWNDPALPHRKRSSVRHYRREDESTDANAEDDCQSDHRRRTH